MSSMKEMDRIEQKLKLIEELLLANRINGFEEMDRTYVTVEIGELIRDIRNLNILD